MGSRRMALSDERMAFGQLHLKPRLLKGQTVLMSAVSGLDVRKIGSGGDSCD